ncbi:ICOS ligand-like [Symphorus nematophorus]
MSSMSLLILFLCASVRAQISTQLPTASVGGSVLISCSLPGDPQSLRWFYWQEDKSKNVLFHWDSRGNPQPVAPKYENRCQVFETEFRSGNISIRLDNVAVEDDQKTFWTYVGLYDEQRKVLKLLERWCKSKLQVSAPYQHLNLTVNSTANRATCTARGGYPEPQVSWTGRNKSSATQLDLQDAETSLQQDPREKTFSVTSSVSVKELHSVTCCVNNPRVNHSCVEQTIKIVENHQGRNHWITATIVPVAVVILLCVWLCRKYGERNLSPERTETSARSADSAQEGASNAFSNVPGGNGSQETVSLTERQILLHHPTVKKDGAADSSTDEDAAAAAAAAEQKEKLLKSGNGDETRTSESKKDE